MRPKSNVEFDEELDIDRYMVALERATELGLTDKLLDVARSECEWRERVEDALQDRKGLGRCLTGGAKPKDVWDAKKLLRKKLIEKIMSDTEVLRFFALTHPTVYRFDKMSRNGEAQTEPSNEETVTVEQFGEKMVSAFGVYPAVLASFLMAPEGSLIRAYALETACSELEREKVASATEETPLPETSIDSGVALEETAELREQLAKLKDELANEQALRRKQAKELKQEREALRKRSQEVSRKDKKITELSGELASLKEAQESLTRQLRQLRSESDEQGREIRKLNARVDSGSTGLRTIEEKRASEARESRERIEQMSARLNKAIALGQTQTARVESLESKLAAEREQRKELETAFSAFGMDDLLSDSQSFGEAVDALVRFRDSVSAYAARQSEREQQRQEAEREAHLEREKAAKLAQEQHEAELSWQQQEQAKLLELETYLFTDIRPDHVIIDGHNLILRVWRPDEESSTRQWVQKLVVEMAQRVEEKGWDTRFHLVFDTPHDSNVKSVGRGVDVYFQNNVTEGGADQRIAQIMEEGNPKARYLVVSTDRKDVWTAALELEDGHQYDIDLVQVELLAKYLETLSRVGK